MVLGRIGATIVLKTSSSSEAVAAIERSQPRLLTLELDTPPGEPDGFEVMRRASTLVPSRAIVLSRHHDPAHIDAALAAGAAAYIVKTAHPDDVALGGSPSVRPFRLPGGRATLRRRAARPGIAAGWPGPPGRPTRRELEILRLVAEGHSNSQLARMLWVTEQTVKFHLSNIYRKLGVANRTEASRWAQVNGLLDDELSLA